MSGRNLYGIEKGLRILAENGTTGVDFLFGSAAPGGDTAEQDAASRGSLYCRTDGTLYQKELAGTGADKWKIKLSPTIANWRQETVRASTNDTLSAGATDPSGWSDNEQGLDDTDFAVGEFVLGDVDGTPALFKIDSIASPNITLSAAIDALADGDMLITRNHLPDTPAAQEKQALLLYNGSSIIKIADFNWAIADGIALAAAYSAGSGNITNADTVNSAIQKADGNIDAVNSQIGRGQTDTHMGTYTGSIIPDDESAKQNIQSLELNIEDNHARKLKAAVTTEDTLDEVLVDDKRHVVWNVWMSLDSAPENVETLEIFAVHNGKAAADADDTDDAVGPKLKIGSAVGGVVSVDLDGTGATQKMRLRVSAAAAVTFRSLRRYV